MGGWGGFSKMHDLVGWPCCCWPLHAVVVEQAHWGRFGVGETGAEGSTVVNCDVLEGMSDSVGMGEGLDG